MISTAMPVLAWAESPLQLIGAAEWAAAHGRRVPLAGRLTPQMSETADELIRRGAMFGATDPYLGVPWNLLARHPHWLVGDGFSGQFRLAASILRPRRITFLDDGANTIAYADSLIGRRPYSRPGVVERGLTDARRPLRARADPRPGAGRTGRVLHRVRASATDDPRPSRISACGSSVIASSGRDERHAPSPPSPTVGSCSAARDPATAGCRCPTISPGSGPRHPSPRHLSAAPAGDAGRR